MSGKGDMNKDEIGGKLRSVFQEVFQENNLILTREMTAKDVAKWDSLRHIQMIAEVETAFGITFKLREVMIMKNVGDLIDRIHAKTADDQTAKTA
jgi:acyl carrier protein